MEEKIIIEGKYEYINKLKKCVLWLFIIDIVLGIISYVFYTISENYASEMYRYRYNSARYNDFRALRASCNDKYYFFLLLFVIILIIAIILTIHFIAVKNTELVVTTKRAYGRGLWGKRVDLPLDSISAIGTTANIFKGICISTSSGKIVFYYISNKDDIHKEVSKLLIERQNTNNNTNNITPQNVANSMDDIFKLKEMLDMGIISQEEFETKKKQLLGL